MKRRDFIKDTAMLVAAAGAGSALKAADRIEGSVLLQAQQPVVGDKLITSPPMLQNYAETSIGVAFAVSALANGMS